uniref:Uncharacterized protein n=1 Tax=Arundo donax TaxID=35708 RepID=A0A0A9EVH2_ARUDO
MHTCAYACCGIHVRIIFEVQPLVRNEQFVKLNITA